MSASASSKTKKLTLLNVVAAMFTSIFLVDALVPAATVGSATIIWYLIFGFAFYIPYGLITAEFATKIPDEGGVYAWVKKTLGVGTAKRVSWYYWVNVGIWAPSIALYISQLIAYMWIPNMDYGSATYAWVTMIIAITFMWASLAFSYFPIAENTHLYNSATIGKIIVVLFLFIGMFTYIGQGKNPETDFGNIPDQFSEVGTWIMFFPALVYNVLGLEAIAGEASRIKNPRKTMARATIIVSISLLIFYVLSTVALQYIFNTAGALDLTGIMQGFANAFGANEMGAQILINILAIIFLYTMFIETMGWVSGANAGVAESAENKELPGIFKWRNKKDMPFKNSFLIGLIGTIELVLFTGIGQIVGGDAGDTIFWSLFAASSNILFLAYFLMFFAYVKAKWTGQLNKYDGFSLKKWLGISMGIVSLLVLMITYFLLLWSPGYDLLVQTLPIVISVVVAMGIGEICFLYANHHWRGSWKNNLTTKGVKNGS